ncbi:MAG: hypothetical protein JKY66_10915 [Spongiibacteraceae bacterium]|nr:hypothetical protein [Spongiibacteraceae bacterium]
MDKVSHLTMDITGTIDVTDPKAVCNEVMAILGACYPERDLSIIQRVYRDFAKLYTGTFPGYLACDTTYHDIQHVLDVSLAMARLIDGYEHSQQVDSQLGVDLAIAGVIIALFHDSGYIRREGDEAQNHGAQYTKVHVSRSAQFMAHYLPTIGMADIVPLASKLVHFTGYEFVPDQIEVDDPKHRIVGSMVGTADVIAQMADPAYLEKCRDRLYPELELGGVARQRLPDGTVQVVYESAEDLLVKTPQFIKGTITDRLDGYFDGLYRYVEFRFGGRNLYMEALENNCRHLENLLAKNDRSLLNASPLRP